MKRFFWWLAKIKGAESLQNIYTSTYYLHRVYPFGNKLVKGVAGLYSESRVCFNLFTSSDLDVEHNHPWGYFTLVLSGGYYEITGDKKEWRGPGWCAFRGHDEFHRVEIPEGGHAMTFFIKGRRKKNSTFFKSADGIMKDLKYWKTQNIQRDQIGKMIIWRTPEEVKNDING
jgi:hypothetical protein